eukprot:237955-Amphidinium_carterae.1
MGPDLISRAIAGAVSAGAASVTGGNFYPVLLPLFSQLTESLDIALIPYLNLQSYVDTTSNLTMNGRVNVDVTTDPNTTFMEVAWTHDQGLIADASLDKDVQVSFTGESASEVFTVGLRACT